MQYDIEVAEAITLAQSINVRIRIRGTDENPVVVLQDKTTNKSLNGIDLRKRFEKLNRKPK